MKIIDKKFLPWRFNPNQDQKLILNQLEEIACLIENGYFWSFKKYKKHGIDLHGSVGTGKTTLMLSFYYRMKIKKRLVHYQEFMQDVHNQLHLLSIKKPDQQERLKEIVAKYH